MKSVLVIDDDAAMREVLKIRLQEWGYDIITAENGKQAQELIALKKPGIIICDVVMPELSGLDLLKLLRVRDHPPEVILISAYSDIDMAVEAIKNGARDFVAKPIDYDKLKAILDEILEAGKRQTKLTEAGNHIRQDGCFRHFIGRSKPMKKVFSLIQEVAAIDVPVLISGQSGTGKELVARAIHKLSTRAGHPFFAINAAAIPPTLIESELFGYEKGAFTGANSSRPGCFEMANGGTLLLDEISEMSTELQAKLLRVLEEGKVRRIGGKAEASNNVRVLAATNRNIAKAVEEGMIRTDLFYRLNVFNIELPPLNERGSDIYRLTRFFIKNFNEDHKRSVKGVEPEVKKLFMDYDWPGNVRELRNVVQHAVVLAKEGLIRLDHLPSYLGDPEKCAAKRVVCPAGTPLEMVEKEMILKTLELTGFNKAETARLLGIDVKTVRNKLRSLES